MGSEIQKLPSSSKDPGEDRAKFSSVGLHACNFPVVLSLSGLCVGAARIGLL